MPPDMGKMLIIGAFFTMLSEMFLMVFRFIRHHPFMSLGIVITLLIGKWLYGAFGLDVVDVRKYANMTEVEISRQLDATECWPEGVTVYCEYDYGETKIWYNARSNPIRMEMKPWMDDDFGLNEEFYTYALHRIGIDEYHAPESASIDRVVWRNVEGINATLETNDRLRASKWTIEFNSNAGI